MHDRIDEHNVIKVADFGLCEDVYSYGYFCQRKDGVLPREEKVPIRWMAPESIEGGKYSEKTDVVRLLPNSNTSSGVYTVCVCVCSGHLE